MENLDNTGLKLIGATIERVCNKHSLFASALKKLVNSTEEGLDDFLKRKIVKAENRKEIIAVLSDIISTVNIPATSIPFVVKEKFVVNTGEEAEVKISCVTSDFEQYFGGKVEEIFSGSTVGERRLLKNVVDDLILKALGGQKNAETALTEIYFLMRSGILSKTDYYLFYVKDVNNKFRAVYVRWHGDGWYVYAHSVEVPFRWYADGRVFSRNSSVA